jgi:hypothetical protein
MIYFQIYEQDTESTVKPFCNDKIIGDIYKMPEGWSLDHYSPSGNTIQEMPSCRLKCLNKPTKVSYFRFTEDTTPQEIILLLKVKLAEVCGITNLSKVAFILSGGSDRARNHLANKFEIIGHAAYTTEYLVKFKAELEKVVKELIL